MNYTKLIFHEDLCPDVVGRTLTFNCKRTALRPKRTRTAMWSRTRKKRSG